MKIVIVDPSRVVLKVVSATLDAAGYECIPYCDAAHALERVRADPFVDVLMTSLEPHGMTGLELCREARRLAGARRALYVVVMSSSPQRRALIEALDAGADDFIDKPPAPEELLARLRVAKRVSDLHGDLIRHATIDALTGVLNRRAFFEHASEHRRASSGFDSLAIFDIDRFKLINDTHGHSAGDAAIRAVAQVAASGPGHVGRLGGEEFGILFDGARLDDAIAECERLRVRMSGIDLSSIGRSIALTCSFGVCEWRAAEDIDDALKRADVALYAAKSGGRDRVVAATAPRTAGAVIVSAARGAQRPDAA